MKRLVLIPAVLAVMVLATFPAVFATPSTPFNASFSGSFTFTSQTTAAVTGTGRMGHLGETSFAAINTVTGLASCQSGFTSIEQDTFISASGDKLFATAHETICPTSANTSQISGPLTITGGTGRFEHASGTGFVHISTVMTSTTTGTFSATTTGTITY